MGEGGRGRQREDMSTGGWLGENGGQSGETFHIWVGAAVGLQGGIEVDVSERERDVE